MGRSGPCNNYGLDPVVERTCPKCQSVLAVCQRWTERVPQQPPPCPGCREQFLTIDTGHRTNSYIGQEYVQSHKIEYTLINLKTRNRQNRSTEEVSPDKSLPSDGGDLAKLITNRFQVTPTREPEAEAEDDE